MIFQKKFKKFDFQKFLDFVRDLLTRYRLGHIKFYPHQGKEFFDDYQLVHIAPDWDTSNKRGFIWVWSKKQSIVRSVTFDQFNQENTCKITMTVDLDKKTITLDRIENLSAAEVEDSLEKYFSDDKNNSGFLKSNSIVIYGTKILMGVTIGLITAFLIYIFGWNK